MGRVLEGGEAKTSKGQEDFQFSKAGQSAPPSAPFYIML